MCPEVTIPGWQGVWKDLGRFPGYLHPLRTWDFTPEQTNDPSRVRISSL